MIPESAYPLLDGTNHAFVATLMPDGSPQVTPVWIQRDGQVPVFNTARGRVKAHNIERDPRIALVAWDPADPETYLQVRGRAELIDEGAQAHNDALHRKYQDRDRPRSGETRVIVRVHPEAVHYRRLDG
jgi:PPOX class probable F420-dependent enzyme